MAAAFLAAEWMALTHTGSFAGVLNVVGTLVVSLLAGIFPVLLLVSSRRKGEYVPAGTSRRFGNPVLLGTIYLLFVASVFLHGLLVWDNPVKQLAALLTGAAILVMTVTLARRGAFTPRANIELRAEDRGTATFAVTAAGRPAETNVRLQYPQNEERLSAAAGDVPAFPSLRRASFNSPRGGVDTAAARELKICAHTITAKDDSQPLPAHAEVRVGDDTFHFDLELSRGQALLPLAHASWTVDITLANRR